MKTIDLWAFGSFKKCIIVENFKDIPCQNVECVFEDYDKTDYWLDIYQDVKTGVLYGVTELKDLSVY